MFSRLWQYVILPLLAHLNATELDIVLLHRQLILLWVPRERVAILYDCDMKMMLSEPLSVRHE